MLTIQSAMLVALGVLVTTLLVLLLLPLYRARTVRLTERRLKQSMPLTEAEIAADKDRIRADYAMKVHKLESKVEQAELSAARQQIELNRRDAAISALEGQVGTLKSTLEEHENARRVLEQTITDRFPKVELRLNEAKKLLFQRDREIQSLSDTASRQAKALEEAAQINTQQRDEVLRLNNALVVRAARGREGPADARFEAEVALRAELEELKARNRELATMISRLQASAASREPAAAAIAAAPASVNGSGANAAMSAGAGEIDGLRRQLAEAEAALRRARIEAETSQSGRSELEVQLRAMRTKTEDQAAQIAKLSAGLAAYEGAGSDERSVSLKDSRIALKSRMHALQAENEAQANTIQKMRAEIAAANERLARQAAHFMDEMRRLGTGAPASAQARRPQAQEPVRKPLAERIVEPRPVRAQQQAAGQNLQDQSRVSGFLRALGGGPSTSASETLPAMADPERDVAASPVAVAVTSPAGPNGAEQAAPRKGRLLERITNVAKG